MKRFIMFGMSLVLVEACLVFVSLGQRPTPSPADSPTQTGKAPDSSKFDEPMALEPINRFDGRTTLKNPRLEATGAKPEVQMTLRTWTIPNRQRIERFPEQGFLIVQVRSGDDFFTVIDGVRQQRKVDEFFTVPAGAAMSIETGNDTVVMQTLAIKQP